MHRDIVSALQSDRKGLRKQNFKSFCKSSTKERRDVNERGTGKEVRSLGAVWPARAVREVGRTRGQKKLS